MTTVADVATETGRPTAEVLDACHALGIVASGPTSGLSSDEHRRLREALGAEALPEVPRGSTTERPGPAPPSETTGPPSPAKPRLSARTATRIGLAVFLLVAVVVSVTALGGGDDDAARCVDLRPDGPVEVPCDEPHDAEVLGVQEVPDGAYPGREALTGGAEAPCRERLAAAAGDDGRGLRVVLLVPTAATWARGDRTVTCLVEDPGGRLVGSVAGSDR